jgi:hypothetical protein
MKYPVRFLVATLLAASCQIIHAALTFRGTIKEKS